jgi:hypothetical protein
MISTRLPDMSKIRAKIDISRDGVDRIDTPPGHVENINKNRHITPVKSIGSTNGQNMSKNVWFFDKSV